VVPEVLKEYSASIFKLKKVPGQFQTQHGWMRCVGKVLLVGGWLERW